MERDRTPLREKVYNYLRSELAQGKLEPGRYIDMGNMAESLNISKTPLRDALILLESDGIVTIYPRKGIMVNPVTMDTIRDIYQIGSGLESALMMSVFDYIAPVHINRMKDIIHQAMKDFEADDFSRAYDLNRLFHSIFHDLSVNVPLRKQLDDVYDRLFNFPARDFDSPEVKAEELDYWKEHTTIVELIENGKKKEAADFIRDVHWTLKEGYTKALHVLLPCKG